MNRDGYVFQKPDDERAVPEPPKVANHATGFAGKLGLRITTAVGTMTCAALFACLALISLPTVLKQAGFGVGFDFGDGTVTLVAWCAQTFLQLVLLSIILVGTNLQSAAADARAQHVSDEVDRILAEMTKGHDELHAHIEQVKPEQEQSD